MKINTKFKGVQQDNSHNRYVNSNPIQRPAQFKSYALNSESLKTNNFPALGYYNPDVKKQYAQKNSIQTLVPFKTSSQIKQLKKQLFECQDTKIRSLGKPKQEIGKNPRKKQFYNIHLEQDKNIKKLERSESTQKYLPKSIREIQDIFNLFKNPSKSLPKKLDDKTSNNSNRVNQAEKIKLQPISITKKQFHRKYNSFDLQKYEQQETLFAQFTQNKLREVKEKQNDDFLLSKNEIKKKQLNKKVNPKKYLKSFHKSIDLEQNKEKKSKFRLSKNFYFTPWKQDNNDNQDFFSRVFQ